MMDPYFEKVERFNKREDYLEDVNVARLLLQYCVSKTKTKKIIFVGTGLGEDVKIVKDINNFKIFGIEPRESFQKKASSIYNQIGAKMIKTDLGEFSKTSNSSGIFLFIHSINHIPRKQLSSFKKSLKDAYIILINPNPKIEEIVGKTDTTVISYLDAKEISKILNCEIIFDFYYNLKKIKGIDILLREAILMKAKN